MSPVVKFALILAIVLFLVGIFVVILRKLTGGKLIPSAAERNRSRQPRLGVVDIYDLDRTRQLVLLRRDNVEHLLLIGGLNDVVIETNIVRVTTGRANLPSDIQLERQDSAFEAVGRPTYETSPRPVVEAANLRYDTAADPLLERPTQPLEPIFEVPVSVNRTPAFTSTGPQDLSPQQAAVAAASLAAVAAATQYVPQFAANVEETVPDFLKGEKRSYQTDQDFDAHAQLLSTQNKQDDIAHFNSEPQFSPPIETFSNASPIADRFSPQQPLIPHPVTFEEPVITSTPKSWVSQTDSLSMQPETGSTFNQKRFVDLPEQIDPAPVVPTASEAAYSETKFTQSEQSFDAYKQYEEYAEEVSPVLEEAPVVQESQQTINLDDATLSDMARQLEEALKTADLSRGLNITEPEPVEEQEPLTASSSQHTAEIKNTISGPFGYQVIDTRQVSTVTETKPEPILSTPTATELEDVTQPVTEAKQETPNLQREKAAAAHDPFSLDDIEAEFARLLGR